ncbi:MAG: NAD(+) synthase [Bacteroidales bacterium]|jgi:NAD+ synthase (glutamine-hydrolysing)|nr:NAD(+) synthase [Bacteroidales bacterium]
MIEIAQIHVLPANLEENYKAIRKCLKEASKKSVKTLIFPAFSLTGYPIADELKSSEFVSQCWAYVERILKYIEGLTVVLDIPFAEHHQLVHRLLCLENGKIKAFSDNSCGWKDVGLNFNRYFTTSEQSKYPKSFKFGLAFASDLERKLEKSDHFEKWIVLDAWSFNYQTIESRTPYFCKLAKQYCVEICVANAVGGQGSLILAGGSLQISSEGKIVKQQAYFAESFLYSKTPKIPASQIEWMYEAIVCGIRDYFADRGLKTAVLGLSGGIDSAVVLPLAVAALGRKNVLGVLMPSPYSSEHSIADAVKSADNLGVDYHIIPIEQAFKTMHQTLLPVFGKRPFSLAEENLQARIRGMILMGISNKLGHVLLNTSNKTEAAVGYGTLYGDLCGGLSVIGDLYKFQVYELANFINRKRGIIPQNSINKTPSAELRPNQKDSDSLPEYDVLDAILQLHLEQNLSASQIIANGFGTEIVNKTLKLVQNSAYKRRQTPPQLRISNAAFNIDRITIF